MAATGRKLRENPVGAALAARAATLAETRADLLRPGWRRFVMPWLIVLAMTVLFFWGLGQLGFTFARFANGMERMGFILQFMVPPVTEGRFWIFVDAIVETLAIAFLGTFLGALIAFPLSLIAARNVTTMRIVQFTARRGLDTIRAVDTLIWAIIFVGVVGLGPFAGVLAIAASDIGGFAKLFSEAMEASDRRPQDGVRASGASRPGEVTFGLLPQVMPVMISQVLYAFESNTRSATIIGIVGAGGIGLFLSDLIRTGEWQQVLAIVLMVLVVVTLIDQLSARLRFAIIGRTSVV